MNERIQNQLADLKARQLAGAHMPCPRCGLDTMKDKIHTNAMSRHADIYVCDDCGTAEAMLVFMQNSLPLEDWACFKPALNLKALTADELSAHIIPKHLGNLKTLFERWLDANGKDDFEAYEREAKIQCPELTELWERPFRAVYQATDGQVIVRFRQADIGIEMAVDVVPKAK